MSKLIGGTTTDGSGSDQAFFMDDDGRVTEACSDCFGSLSDPETHCEFCGDHMDGDGTCQGCGA